MRRPLLTLAGLAVAACSDSAPTAPALHTGGSPLLSTTAAPTWASTTTGEVGPGSSYEIFVPEGWNGDVVFYGHGIRDALEPVSLRDQDNAYLLRDRLGAMGYAVAASSFSHNGLALKDGAQRTHQLRGIFTERYGEPRRSFLMGHSLGGTIALDLAERFPTQYAGALPLCAMTGGSQAQVDYIVHVRALFDLFYPGVLLGTAKEIPEHYIIDGPTQLRIQQAVMANPGGLFVIANTLQTPLEFRPGRIDDLLTSLIYALSYHARGVDNLLPLTKGQFPFDNMQTVYSYSPSVSPLPVNPAVIAGTLAQYVNPRVGRFSGDRMALEYLERYVSPDGDLEIPVLTMHTRWDPLVPYFHERLYAETVRAAGASDLLLQRTTNEFGHCKFQMEETVDAFLDLVEWVNTGVKPEA